MVEHFPSDLELPKAVENLLERGIQAVPHGLSLSLGGAEPPTQARLAEIEALAKRTNAQLVWLIENPCAIANAGLIAERMTTEFATAGGRVRQATLLVRHLGRFKHSFRHLVSCLRQGWLARTAARPKPKAKLNLTLS